MVCRLASPCGRGLTSLSGCWEGQMACKIMPNWALKLFRGEIWHYQITQIIWKMAVNAIVCVWKVSQSDLHSKCMYANVQLYLQRETTSAIFPRHDSHRWLLRRCLATVAAVLRHQLPPAAGYRRLLQGCLAAVASVLRRRLPPAKWWESLTCC